MQLEDYFDFLAPDDIRVKGTRVGIENILYRYCYCGQSPEAIEPEFRTVTLEQIYATILYYLSNQDVIGKYLESWVEYCQQAEAEYDKHPSPVVLRLRRLKQEREAVQLAK